MSKILIDEATVKLVLEALENSVDLVSHEARNAEELYGKYPSRLPRIQGLVAFEVAHEKAITALQEALEKPDFWQGYVPEPVKQGPVYHLRQYGDVTKEQLDRYMATGDINPQPAQQQSCYCPNCEALNKELAELKAQQALDKKAENARELGLDYEPAPMSQPNRVIAYSAASKLRELGYEWVADAWKQPAQQEPVTPTAVEMKNAAANLALMREMWGNADEPVAKVNDDGFIVETGLLISPGQLLYTTPQPAQQPFGYFKAEPFGWTDCAETDEGAVALYERSPAQRKPLPDFSSIFGDIKENT